MMKDNFPIFAVIGKPNNGKSTIISTLTMDDEPNIDPVTGTTKVKAKYDYTFGEQTVCRFLDTPGFINAKFIYRELKTYKKEEPYGNDAVYKFISTFKMDEKYKTDCEILDAVLESDYIIFVVDTSSEFNINSIGAELNILKGFQKPKAVIDNQKNKDENYSVEWKEKLQDYGMTNIYTFNPLKSSFLEIENVFKNLYTIDLELIKLQFLDKLLNTHKALIKEKMNKSAKSMASMLIDILRHKESETFRKENIEAEDMVKVYEKYKKKIYTIEHKGKKDIQNIWGYYKLEIEDSRQEYDGLDSQKLGWTKKKLALIGSVVFGVSGAAADAAALGFGFGTATAMGIVVGGTGGWFAGKALHVELIKGQKVIYRVSKKNINTSVIILKRALEHMHQLVNHGHANREKIIITNDIESFKFNNDWDFNKKEAIDLAKIHKNIIVADNSSEMKKNEEKLSEMIKQIIDREIIKPMMKNL